MSFGAVTVAAFIAIEADQTWASAIDDEILTIERSDASRRVVQTNVGDTRTRTSVLDTG